MKLKFAFLTAISAALVAVGILTALPVQSRPQPAAAAVSDKYDGDCTGQETAGRCADKCPAGSYSIGYKEDGGAAICKLEPTGCPYGDSIPLGPECDKQAANQPQASITPDVQLNQCGGGK